MNYTIVDNLNDFRGETEELEDAIAIAKAQPEAAAFLPAKGPIYILHNNLFDSEGDPIIAAIFTAGQTFIGEGQIIIGVDLWQENRPTIEITSEMVPYKKFTPEDIEEFNKMMEGPPHNMNFQRMANDTSGLITLKGEDFEPGIYEGCTCGECDYCIELGQEIPLYEGDYNTFYNDGDELPFDEYNQDGCPDCQTGIYNEHTDGPLDQTEIVD